MIKITLNREQHKGPTIMIFAEGTILKPSSPMALFQHKSYIPIGRAPEIIQLWDRQGANIIYCTSRKKGHALDMAALLKQFSFPGIYLSVREHKESYRDIVESLQPHILIEDDCRSIGGSWQMCITKVTPEIKTAIRSIVVPEFKGIDHLPSDIASLQKL